MSKPANETLDIFVQQATLNEAWKSNMDMYLVKEQTGKERNNHTASSCDIEKEIINEPVQG